MLDVPKKMTTLDWRYWGLREAFSIWQYAPNTHWPMFRAMFMS